MNRALADVGGSVLAVSQFTLYGDTRKGRRPSFDRAAPADVGRVLFDAVVAELRAAGVRVETGTYRAHMQVDLRQRRPGDHPRRQPEEVSRDGSEPARGGLISPREPVLKPLLVDPVEIPDGFDFRSQALRIPAQSRRHDRSAGGDHAVSGMTGSASRQAPDDDVGERDTPFRLRSRAARQRPDTARPGPDAQPAQASVSQRARMALQAVPCVATSASNRLRAQAPPGGGRRLRHFLRHATRSPRRGVGWRRSGTAGSAARVSRRSGRRPARRRRARWCTSRPPPRSRPPRRRARDRGCGGGPSGRGRRAGSARRERRPGGPARRRAPRARGTGTPS